MRIAQHLISGGTQTKAPPSIAAHIASNAIDFFRVMKKSQLLPLNAADRAIRRVLTKIIDCRTSSALTQNQIERVQLISEPRQRRPFGAARG